MSKKLSVTSTEAGRTRDMTNNWNMPESLLSLFFIATERDCVFASQTEHHAVSGVQMLYNTVTCVNDDEWSRCCIVRDGADLRERWVSSQQSVGDHL